ncbi:MAG: HAMP domain-containing histidine kinase [Clostridiales bacterium]|jgi:signal transduction histidine kinase|nr:HAMP domain-containing histidine kinase [Clostridiales bacterium]
MKFWQKAFFCIIAVFLLGFDAMGYTLAERGYALNREYALAAAETEQDIIKQSLYESIALSAKNFETLNPANLAVTIGPYANFYQNQGIYFEIYQDGAPAYSNSPSGRYEKPQVRQGEQLTEIKEIEGNLYCLITSRMDEPYGNLQYVYIKDMQSLADFKAKIIESFVTIGVVVSLILSVAMLLMLVGLTVPFRKLNAAAAEISAGNYSKRAAVKSRDEVGDFARSFDAMTDSIETHIAELSRMTESKQNFIDNLAHEMRTPITAIVGYAELLKYADCSEVERETAVDHIISQSGRIQNLSSKLLDLAYMGSASIPLLPVKLEDLLAGAQAALKHRLREKNIDLRVESQPTAIINGDAELLTSLLVNLIDNAVNASSEGSTVEIYASREAGRVLIEVADHGKGMEPSEAVKIVEPFYRIDSSRSRSGGGTGLGLALCARICEMHGASLDICSEPGKGATVKILFTTP